MSFCIIARAMIIGFMLAIFSCGGSEFNGGEDYGNLLDTPGGLTLTEEKHPAGWGRSDCTSCHSLENIHLVNRTGLDIDIEEIHNDAIDEGVSSCSTCHGGNGV